MSERISRGALDQLFLEARSHNAWKSGEVPDDVLRELVDIAKMGPTSANCCPARPEPQAFHSGGSGRAPDVVRVLTLTH